MNRTTVKKVLHVIFILVTLGLIVYSIITCNYILLIFITLRFLAPLLNTDDN